MPKFIGDLDCRLTLYRNCRNTENIAVTSLRPITERKPKVFEGAVKGTPAKIHFCDSVQNERERIDSIIDDLAADGYRDIVLLTCKTEATSILSDSVNNGKYRNKYLFTTCRKFKGLEADVVILHRYRQGKYFQNPGRNTAGQAGEACPAVCIVMVNSFEEGKCKQTGWSGIWEVFA